MKKIITLTALLLAVCNMQSQSWTTTLNTVSGNGNFGTINSKAIDFYTGNTKRMSLSPTGILSIVGLVNSAGNFITANSNGELGLWTGIGDGSKILFGDNTWKTFPFAFDGSNITLPSSTGTYKFGINTSSAPTAELDVSGSGKVSSNFTVGGDLNSNNQFKITSLAASGGTPPMMLHSVNKGTAGTPNWSTYTYKGPCNVWYANTTHGTGPTAYSTSWLPPGVIPQPDLIQVYESTGSTNVLNMGLFNGDGIIGLEPYPSQSTTKKLKLNPGCPNDVFICEGGGYTWVAGDGSVGKTWQVGTSGTTPNSQLDVFITGAQTKGLMLLDPSLAGTNQSVFEVSKSGQATLGNHTQPITNAMLTVGQALKTAPGISLLDNSGTPNLPIFNVWGDGKTEIYSSNTDALTIKDAATSTVRHKVQTDGKTEITSFNTDALIIKNGTSGSAIHSVHSDGKTEITTSNTDALLINDATAGTLKFKVATDGSTYMGEGANTVASKVVIAQGNKTSKALSLVDNSNLTSITDFFSVYGNGYTEINISTPGTLPDQDVNNIGRVFAIKDKAQPKDIFVVKQNGKVYAREVEVSLVTTFPDYVFKPDYKLLSLKDLDTYIQLNKHLPGYEAGESYEKNGLNVNTMLLKQQEKIEELTLYILQLEKRLGALETK